MLLFGVEQQSPLSNKNMWTNSTTRKDSNSISKENNTAKTTEVVLRRYTRETKMCDIVQLNDNDLLARRLNQQLQMNPEKESKFSSPFSSWNTIPYNLLAAFSSATSSANTLFVPQLEPPKIDSMPTDSEMPPSFFIQSAPSQPSIQFPNVNQFIMNSNLDTIMNCVDNRFNILDPVKNEPYHVPPPPPMENKRPKMESFPGDRVVDFKHLIYNLLVENYNNPRQNNFVQPFQTEISSGVIRQGFKFCESENPDKKLPEMYAQHIRKANLQLENQNSVFIQDLYKYYLRSCVELLSKYFVKVDKYTFLYDEVPLFIPGGNLEEAEERISKMGTIQRRHKRNSSIDEKPKKGKGKHKRATSLDLDYTASTKKRRGNK